MKELLDDDQLNEYESLSYDQQYDYLCDTFDSKQCQRCGVWVRVLFDGICEDCQYDLAEQRRNTDDWY